MKQLGTHASIMVLLGSLGLAACGGGGSTADTLSGMSSGVITGFGSVFVNGVEYETANAGISLDGTPGSETDLAVGMVVEVEGSVNADGVTGTAERISFADELEGYVLEVSVDPVTRTGTLNVMGQTVLVNSDTLFAIDDPAGNAFDRIVVGAVVEVSGHASGTGHVYATRIEVKLNEQNLEVKGVVTGLDAQNHTFQLGGLNVDYGNATSVPAGLADGMYVEVRVANAPVSDGNGGYTAGANEVEIEDDGRLGIQGQEGEEIEIRGIVTGALDGNTFQVNGQTVILGGEYLEDGYTEADLTVGTKVEVEGRFNADGVLVADEVGIGEEGIEYEGRVAAIDVAARSVTVDVMGEQGVTVSMTFQVNTDTMMVDERDEGGYVRERYFDLTDLFAGDYVQVKADANGIALRLERDDAPL